MKYLKYDTKTIDKILTTVKTKKLIGKKLTIIF